MVGREDLAQQTQGDDDGGGRGRSEDEKHDHCLYQHGLQGGTPTRMRPVIAPGRKTSPVALVDSICGVSAERRAVRT